MQSQKNPEFEQYLEDVPEKYHLPFWELTGEGKSPEVVLASIEYTRALLENEEKTQSEIASQYDVSKTSIGRVYKQVVELLDRSNIAGSKMMERSFIHHNAEVIKEKGPIDREELLEHGPAPTEEEQEKWGITHKEQLEAIINKLLKRDCIEWQDGGYVWVAE